MCVCVLFYGSKPNFPIEGCPKTATTEPWGMDQTDETMKYWINSTEGL